MIPAFFHLREGDSRHRGARGHGDPGDFVLAGWLRMLGGAMLVDKMGFIGIYRGSIGIYRDL